MASEKFDVSVKRAKWGDREVELSITHNGCQWSTIGLFQDELQIVRQAIDDFIVSESNDG